MTKTAKKPRRNDLHFDKWPIEDIDTFLRYFLNTAMKVSAQIALGFNYQSLRSAADAVSKCEPGALLLVLGAALKAQNLEKVCNCGRCDLTAMTEAIGLFMHGYSAQLKTVSEDSNVH